MSISLETRKEKEEKIKNEINRSLLRKVRDIKIILELLENEIKRYDYDKITDSIASLNTSISMFLNELKKL
ncbi:MAG: hypothetical protein ACTSQO_14320 [Candidatus Helarchaeota archaeon]